MECLKRKSVVMRPFKSLLVLNKILLNKYILYSFFT